MKKSKHIKVGVLKLIEYEFEKKSFKDIIIFIIVNLIICGVMYFEIVNIQEYVSTSGVGRYEGVSWTFYESAQELLYVLLAMTWVSIVIKSIGAFKSEWAWKNKPIYGLLTLPVPRYKIYIAKFITCISSYLIYIGISIFTFCVTTLVGVKTFPSDIANEILENFVLYSGLQSREFIISISFSIIFISASFFIALVGKSYGSAAVIIAIPIIFILIFIPMQMWSITEYGIALIIQVIIINIFNIKMFNRHIEL